MPSERPDWAQSPRLDAASELDDTIGVTVAERPKAVSQNHFLSRRITNMLESIDTTLELIKAAFDTVHLPKQLLQFHGVDHELWVESFLGCDYCHWSEIPDSSIEYENSALTVLSHEAFVYFLPAYMTWVLRNYRTSNSTTVEHTIDALDLKDHGPSTRKIKEERVESLSLEQKRAILSFLKVMTNASGHHIASRNAINTYWNRFE